MNKSFQKGIGFLLIFALVLMNLLSFGMMNGAQGASNVTIGYWSFNTDNDSNSKYDGVANLLSGYPVNADVGNATLSTNITASMDSFTGTATNAISSYPAGYDLAVQSGNGNANNGKYLEFEFSTIGLSNIALSFATRGSAAGFNTHQWQYSINGVDFIDFGSNTANQTGTYLLKTISLPTGADNQSNVKVRVVLTGATSSSGNSRFDNILITGSSGDSSLSIGIPKVIGLKEVGETITIQSTITAGNVDTVSAAVYYGDSTDGNSFNDYIVMNNVLNLFTAEYEATMAGTVYYYVYATDGQASSTYPGNISNVTTYFEIQPSGTALQPTAISEAKTRSGEQVTIEGIATSTSGAWGNQGFYIQDDTAGIYVYQNNTAVTKGDRLRVTGIIGANYGELQVAGAVTIQKLGTEAVPAPIELTTLPITADASIEGMSYAIRNVEISGLESVNSYGTFEFDAVKDAQRLKVRVDNRTGLTHSLFSANYGDTDIVDVIGILGSYNGTLQLKPRGAEDFTLITKGEGGSGQQPINGLKISEIQGVGHESSYKNQVVENVVGIVTAKDSGGFYMQDPEPDDNDATSEAIYVYGSSTPVNVGDGVSVNGTVKEYSYTGELSITEIANNPTVTVISSGNELPAPIILGNGGRAIPTSHIDDDGLTRFQPEEDGIDFYESLEFMRVQINDPLIIGAHEGYGEIYVLADNGQASADKLTTHNGLKLADYSGNPEVLILYKKFKNLPNNLNAKVGDSFEDSIQGIVGYSYGYYNIWHTETLPAIVDGGLDRRAEGFKYDFDENQLTVASYNLENFSKENSGDDHRAEEFGKSIVNDLKNPDIIGLIEIQDDSGDTDNGTTTADETYQLLIDRIEAAGGPAYAFTDIAPENNMDGGAPGGNIRVGFLYNPQRVSLVKQDDAGNTIAKGDATTSVSINNQNGNHLSVNPGRINPTDEAFSNSRKPLVAQFSFNNENVFVILNHFSSKGSDGKAFGNTQPPVRSTEVKRHQQAQAVNNFIDQILAGDEDANIVVMGDINDFEFSETIEILKGKGTENVLTDLVDTLPVNERVSYVYKGSSQVLDHILVNNGLANRAKLDPISINAEYTKAAGRLSDHDPMMVQIDFTPKIDSTDTTFTIMHTNDTHAHLDNVARRITAIKNVRVEAGEENTILLDAGDVFSGSLYFNQYLGQADLAFMNMAGYDAMVPGNHEFDKDSKTLANFIKAADFPIVSANINYSGDAELNSLFNDMIGDPAENGKIYPAVVLDVNGEKVGVFGLTTEDTTNISSPSDTLVFENYIEKAQETVNALEGIGINKIVALTHLGHSYDKILAQEVEGIDVIIGGHSHTLVEELVVYNTDTEPTIVTQAKEYSEYLGRLDVTFNEEGILTDWNGHLISIDETIEEDPVAKAKLDELSEPLEALKAEIVGQTNVVLDGERANVRTKETNLGNLIADGMLAKAKAFNKSTTIAIQNGGGIRASIDAGEITLGEVLTVLPFGNTLVTLDLTGAEIIETLENSVSKYPAQDGRFLQVSGIKFSFDPNQPKGERIVNVLVKTGTGYTPINEGATYTVATNNFTANGGDYYTVLKGAKDEGRIRELGFVDYQVFTDYLNTVGAVDIAVEGRITIGTESVNDDDNSGGSSGGGGGSSTPAAPSNITPTNGDSALNNTASGKTAIINTGSSTTAEVSGSALARAVNADITVVVNTGTVFMDFGTDSLMNETVARALQEPGTTVQLGANVLSAEEAAVLQSNQSVQNAGLISVGGKVIDLIATVKYSDGKVKEIGTFAKPVAVTIDLSDADLTESDIANLTAVRFVQNADGTVTTIKLGGKYDAATKKFTFYTDHFSKYAVMKAKKLTKLTLGIGNKISTKNDAMIENDVAPIIINGRTMVPVRFVAENLGADVSWEPSTRTVKVVMDDTVLEMVIDQPLQGFDVKPTIVEGRTMVPLRYVSEKLGAFVLWHPDTKVIDIVQ